MKKKINSRIKTEKEKREIKLLFNAEYDFLGWIRFSRVPHQSQEIKNGIEQKKQQQEKENNKVNMFSSS